MDTAWITGAGVAVGGLGVFAGWFVSGTQRVMEKLTEERREAYRDLLIAADAAHAGRSAGRVTAEERATAARFVSSEHMHEAGCITTLMNAIGSQEAWADTRQWFEEVGRLETQRNSQRQQRKNSRAYTDQTWRWANRV